ncbi:HupE/UreJ family protein [Halioxenophilus sp. WMMB6]|uniref:HupE/UreJ family protein n=1 Tax=Halioxenophilus sp. WMMB6 TaxID=3073815 RepID=UPI00295F54EB|nr:HupE/UreJ family protein [Halioxenophilus sp. WMMB6]
MANRILLLFATCLLSLPLLADVSRPGYLAITQLSATDFDVTFKSVGGSPGVVGITADFDDSVETLGAQLAFTAASANLIHYRIRHEHNLAGAELVVHGFQSAITEVLVRVDYLDGSSQIHRLSPENPRLQFPVQQSWMMTAANYLWFGVAHILVGLDHLLFILALMLLVTGWRKLVTTITAFTLAHSITLILSSLKIVTLPMPPVEAVIALSIVFVANEIIKKQQGRPGLSSRRPWLVAFTFGLLHGLGFAAVLQQIGLPENALVTALVLFNLGVELGQLLFVGAVLVCWFILRPYLSTKHPLLLRIPPYFIGSLASFWVVARVVSFWLG